MKKKSIALAVLSALCFGCSASFALTVGTFDIENFHIAGTKSISKNALPYAEQDVKEIAGFILQSGADIFALQEIQGETSMQYLIDTALPGWEFSGNETWRAQNLYFLWNPKKVTLLSNLTIYYAKLRKKFEGKSFQVFDNPPLSARFKDNATGKEYTLINVHMKSLSTYGKQDKEKAMRYNYFKQGVQQAYLNNIVEMISQSQKHPIIILGNFNDPDLWVIPDADTEDAAMIDKDTFVFSFVGLEKGYSYDNMKSNLDFMGYSGIDAKSIINIKEIETRIPNRTHDAQEHPSHDIVTIELMNVEH